MGVGAALPAQGDDVCFEFRFGSAWLTLRDRRTVLKLCREIALLSAFKPATQRFFGDVIRRCNGALREVVGGEKGDHFGSHEGRESGISVHVVRVEWR